VRWSAAAAMVIGAAASAVCLNSGVFVGPVASAAGNTDFSVLAGVLGGAVAYWFLCGKRVLRETRELPQGASVILEESIDNIG
jgi:NCS1 family nucleobase:cation symporter-1